MRTLLVSLATLLLAGCMGSPEPYHPWKDGTRQPRPDPEQRAEEDARLKLETELPIEIARNEAERAKTLKEIGRVMSEIPTNPWISYERDLVRVMACDTCGKLECDPIGHAEPWLPKGPPERRALALGLGAAAKPAAEESEEESEEEDGEEE
jgi:hypothetical protein